MLQYEDTISMLRQQYTPLHMSQHADFTVFASSRESLSLSLGLARHGSLILIIAVVVFRALCHFPFLLDVLRFISRADFLWGCF